MGTRSTTNPGVKWLSPGAADIVSRSNAMASAHLQRVCGAGARIEFVPLEDESSGVRVLLPATDQFPKGLAYAISPTSYIRPRVSETVGDPIAYANRIIDWLERKHKK